MQRQEWGHAVTVEILYAVTAGAALAYANGSNDVSKGIATLVGSGVTDYRRAIIWGTVWTGAGALLGGLWGSAMIATFGKGLLDPVVTPTIVAALAMLIGAAGWVFLASRTGLPVSTTHALVGAVVGVAYLAYGPASIQWSALGAKVFLPLMLSPAVSLGLTLLLLRSLPEQESGAPLGDCLCVETQPVEMNMDRTGAVAAGSLVPMTLSLATGGREQCVRERPQAVRLTLDHLHWLTSGATSLARGMNDAPKMVALVAAAAALAGPTALPMYTLLALVALGMLTGGVIGGRRVTHVLAEKVTRMDHREGFAANLITAVLVTSGAVYGLPMSTTHVSAGGIVGAGMRHHQFDRRVMRDILLAWVVTLPVAALLGIASYQAMQFLMP